MVSLKKDGISILAIPDFEKLGLERIKVYFELSPSVDSVKAFFGGLHQSAGLRSYSRTMYTQQFDCEFTVPRGKTAELEALLRRLEEMKLIQNVGLEKLLWRDVLMLKTQYYDYARREWDVDFSTLSGDPATVRIPEKSNPAHIDYVDLIMTKELEADPWIKNVELAKKANLAIGDAAYHFNKHIFGRGLIKSFKLNWAGTKNAWLKHSIILKTYTFRHVSGEDVRHAMSILTSVPFTWTHMMTEGGAYVAEVMIPLPHYPEVAQYISTQLRALDLKPTLVAEKDWSCLSTFTIPYLLYDRERRNWEFDSEHALEYTLQMIKAYPSHTYEKSEA